MCSFRYASGITLLAKPIAETRCRERLVLFRHEERQMLDLGHCINRLL
jgi:hypothetical protein